jgi:hypothetical protein
MTITYRLGTPADNPKMQDLVAKVTMPGPVTMCFKREPDFFTGAKVIGDEFWLVLAEDDERPDCLAGLTVISGRDLWIAGKPKRIYYSGDTRVDPYYRRRGIGTEMFQLQKTFRKPEDFMQGLVIKENEAPIKAGRNADKGVFFNDWFSHHIETSFMYTRKGTPRLPKGVEVRLATAADIAAMQAFNDREAPRRNGYPVYDISKLHAGDPYYAGLKISDYALAFRNGEMVAMMAAWNQKAYKQTKIIEFKFPLAYVRPLYNLYASLFGGFKLPPVGGSLNYLSLYNVLVKDDDKDLFRGMIDWVMTHQGQGYDALATCTATGDPLETVPREYKRQKMFTSHFWLSYGENGPDTIMDKRPLYMELGRL